MFRYPEKTGGTYTKLVCCWEACENCVAPFCLAPQKLPISVVPHHGLQVSEESLTHWKFVIMVPLLWVTLLKCHRGHHNGLPQKGCLTLLFSCQLTSRTLFSSPLQTGTISAGGWLWLGTKECFPNLFFKSIFYYHSSRSSWEQEVVKDCGGWGMFSFVWLWVLYKGSH